MPNSGLITATAATPELASHDMAWTRLHGADIEGGGNITRILRNLGPSRLASGWNPRYIVLQKDRYPPPRLSFSYPN